MRACVSSNSEKKNISKNKQFKTRLYKPNDDHKTSSRNRWNKKNGNRSTKSDQLNTPGRAKESLNSKTRPPTHEFCQSPAVVTICCVNTLEPATALNRHLSPLPHMELQSTTTSDSISISTSSAHPLVSRFENFSIKCG